MAFKKDSDPIKDLNLGALFSIRNFQDLVNLDLKDFQLLISLIESQRYDRIIFGDKLLSEYDTGTHIIVLDVLYRHYDIRIGQEGSSDFLPDIGDISKLNL